MTKAKSYETSSENWNVADSYSKIKIMKLLMEIDEYIKIAKTGVAEIQDEFMVNEQTKIQARILALNRFHMTLEMLINNSAFGVKKDDKKILDEWLQALKEIKLDNTYNVVSDKDRRRSQSIKEHEFGIVLNILIDIHRKILIPLNEAGMIYPGGEDDWEMDYSI
jgi:hypothetical protein